MMERIKAGVRKDDYPPYMSQTLVGTVAHKVQAFFMWSLASMQDQGQANYVHTVSFLLSKHLDEVSYSVLEGQNQRSTKSYGWGVKGNGL